MNKNPFLSRFRELIAPPEFLDDPGQAFTARVLNILLMGAILTLVLYACLAIPFLLVEKLFNVLAVLILLLIMGVAWLLLRHRRVRLASALFILGIWLVVTFFLLFSGGMTSVAVAFYVVGTATAAMLLGARGAILHALASSIAGLVMVWLQNSGYSLPRVYLAPPVVGWLDTSISLLIMVILMSLVLSGIQEALRSTQQHLEERKQVEETLRASEEKFRRLFETSRDFLYITDLDGKIIEVNKAASQLSGYSVEELKGRNLQELYFDPNERDIVVKRVSEQGFIENLEIKGRRKDGAVVAVLADSTAIKDQDGKVVGFQGSIKDISDRKREEETLRETEERFSRLSAVTSEGIGISDRGRIVDANPQLATMLGYEPGELIGLNAMDFVAPESRAVVLANETAGVEGPYEHLAKKKDGSIFPVEIRARTISYQGRQTRAAVIRDITERKRAEEDLARQVERLRALHNFDQAVASSMDLDLLLELLVQELVKQLQVDACAVLLVDPLTNKLEFASRQGFRTDALKYTSLKFGTGLAGRAAQDRKTIYIANLAELEDNPSLAQSIVNEGFVTYFGIPMIAKDQLRGVLEIFHRSALALDPNLQTYLETLAGQAAIAIANARLLETTQQGLEEINALYHISQSLAASLDSNQLMKDVVDLLHKDFGFYHVQIFELDSKNKDLVASQGSGEIGSLLKEKRFRMPVGMGILGHTAETGEPFLTNRVEEVIFFVHSPLLPDTQSEMTIPIKVQNEVQGVLDIQQKPPHRLTERQMQLMEAVADQLAVVLQKANLYAKLQDSLRQEKTMRAQLIQSERLALVGRLLASVSHELNNPIQAIQNALFLIKEEEQLSEQGRQDLEIVLSETERMAALIDRLRATYRPTKSEDFQDLQLNTIVEDVQTLIATHMRHKNITFEFQPDPALPTISGVPEQLRQVTLNLCMNAIEAMRTGGTLLVRTERLPRQKKVLLSFSDSGPGIDPQILPHLFEPFVTNKENGTGLGLTITYDIIHQHAGSIQAENNPQGGAIFKVWLPVKRKGGMK